MTDTPLESDEDLTVDQIEEKLRVIEACQKRAALDLQTLLKQ